MTPSLCVPVFLQHQNGSLPMQRAVQLVECEHTTWFCLKPPPDFWALDRPSSTPQKQGSQGVCSLAPTMRSRSDASEAGLWELSPSRAVTANCCLLELHLQPPLPLCKLTPSFG